MNQTCIGIMILLRKKILTFATTNSNILILMSLQCDIRYFKLRLFDPKEFIVYNIKLQIFKDYKIKIYCNYSIPL